MIVIKIYINYIAHVLSCAITHQRNSRYGAIKQVHVVSLTIIANNNK